MKLPWILKLSALLAFFCALGLQGAELRTPKGAVTVRERRVGSATWVCAQDLAKGLKGTFGRDDVSKYPTLVIEGKRILVSTSTPLVSVEGRIVKLQQVPLESEGCLWLPPEFLGEVLGPLLGGKITVVGSTAPAPPASAQAPGETGQTSGSVGVDCLVGSDAVRVTLTGAQALPAEPRQSGQEITLVLPSGRFAPYGRTLGQGIVSSVQVDPDGRRLKITTGPGFKRLEHLKLRNPDRVVLVLTGEGQVPPPQAAQEVQAQPAAAPALPSEPPKKTQAFDLVVIDPGHGGSDTGAIGPTGLQEKDLTLAIAQKLSALLESQGIRTVLTRTTDVLVPLQQRTAIANFNQADLFLSIHLNSSPAVSAKGTETYYLSRQATDLWSSELAQKENAAGGAPAAQGGINLVLWELAQTSSIVESAAMAEIVQQEFNELLGTKDRGVRQAPFVVLEGATMPAVLVEVAFLSNPSESQKLADPTFQDQVASTLAKCVLSFKARYENPSAPPPAP